MQPVFRTPRVIREERKRSGIEIEKKRTATTTINTLTSIYKHTHTRKQREQ